ncbi:hypothetical protein [Streptomyces himastatinicus]|uniref:hypothetical protein n=1 Tax=Streptomyces himastatinicus TaxID=998084 RepID=UPI0001B510E6|nr:hypothetical protein [Streptomyces himastatinicus]
MTARVHHRFPVTRPLRLGEPAERVTSLGPVTAEQGSTGALLMRGGCCSPVNTFWRAAPPPTAAPTCASPPGGRDGKDRARDEVSAWLGRGDRAVVRINPHGAVRAAFGNGGRMVDKPVLERARRILALARG